MPTGEYRTKDNARVSSVTTILSKNLGWNRDVLMRWAHAQGKKGIDFRETTQKAADAGTIAHYLVDCHITGKAPDAERLARPDQKIVTHARRAFDNFLKWQQAHQLTVRAAEQPYVSEKHRFGGCPDGLGKTIYGNSLLDYKTSKNNYVEYKIQVFGGYGLLVEECEPDFTIESFDILRFDKYSAAFTHYHYDATDAIVPLCKQVFLHLLGVEQCRQQIEAIGT
jgi:hypothetical protein